MRSRQVIDMAKAGVYDVASVQTAAVRSGIAGAALTLTVDVMVHHKKPKESMDTA